VVFNYLNYREYLKDFYKYKKASQPQYSYAVFSQRAGIKSPNYLKLVMEGARNITSDSILPFAKALSLNELETIFWENLVAFNQSKTPESRRYHLTKLTRSPMPASGESGRAIRDIRDEWEYYSGWHHAAIRELVLHPQFSEDAAWIARALRGRLSVAQARESLELLERMGFLVRDERGRLRQAERQVRYLNRDDLQNLAIQRFHKATAELALDSLENDPPEARDFSGLTIAVPQGDLKKMKARLSEFLGALNRDFSTADAAEDVFQINFQVIPLTERKNP
jgi:uncharacterized protein (TIGR02147 family)